MKDQATSTALDELDAALANAEATHRAMFLASTFDLRYRAASLRRANDETTTDPEPGALPPGGWAAVEDGLRGLLAEANNSAARAGLLGGSDE